MWLQVMLFSEGFEDSRALSRKMVKLYKLASEQLSQQVGQGRFDHGGNRNGGGCKHVRRRNSCTQDCVCKQSFPFSHFPPRGNPLVRAHM
jgi:hypothetical protein